MSDATPTTTLARICAARPCDSGYRKLVKALGGFRKYGKDTPITVRHIVESNGLDDALWCLRTMPEHSARWRLLAVRCARRVQHPMADKRSLTALDVAERHAFGRATDDELAAARDAAFAAAQDAAGDAAWGAALHNAAEAAYVAAGSAVLVAGRWEKESEWQAQELIRISEEDAR